jgi:hypothetical protein
MGVDIACLSFLNFRKGNASHGKEQDYSPRAALQVRASATKGRNALFSPRGWVTTATGGGTGTPAMGSALLFI